MANLAVSNVLFCE